MLLLAQVRFAVLTVVATVFATASALVTDSSSPLQNETTSWPSLRFEFTVKRASMAIHGHSTFTMIANPAVSTTNDKVLYDTFSTFTEDSTSYNYTLVKGVSYVSTNSSVRCLHTESIPEVNSIVAALNQVVPVSSDNSIECSGDLFKASVHDIDFAVCSLGSSGFKMIGSDVDITVEYLTKSVEISTPTVNSSDCKAMVSPMSITSHGKSLVTGQPIRANDPRRLDAAFGFSSLNSESCKCESEVRPCLFVHGWGIGYEEPGNVDYLRYWGNVSSYTPCCSSIKYTVLDTQNVSWTSATQQQKLCDRALAVSNSSLGSTISDTILVTHSMGGLMLASAIANKRCNLANSSTWVSMGTPMTGSMGSDFTQDSCADQTNYVSKKYAQLTGRCPPGMGMKSLAYENESYSKVYGQLYGTKDLNAMYKAAQKVYQAQVYAVACSQSYSGLVSKYQWKMWLMGSLLPHKSGQNDGMVEYLSCRGGLPESQFGSSYLERFYVTKLNHNDLQFKSGDALFNKAKMPLKWLECLL